MFVFCYGYEVFDVELSSEKFAICNLGGIVSSATICTNMLRSLVMVIGTPWNYNLEMSLLFPEIRIISLQVKTLYYKINVCRNSEKSMDILKARGSFHPIAKI
ncbi:hypothetical protein NQ317_014872 [Molorchus minor]|uniref:Uncharacterized protein n=1 Tax=Molorchus minor TaxID=1323400 RepID=A0ABQ9JUQ6_9CUCU|nr:hypothetical protein NQ317_014872 [Molorchus minor]